MVKFSQIHIVRKYHIPLPLNYFNTDIKVGKVRP